jgi:hypothetical protein
MVFLRVTMALMYCLKSDLVAGLEKKALCCTPAGRWGGGGRTEAAGLCRRARVDIALARATIAGGGARRTRWPDQAQHATYW